MHSLKSVQYLLSLPPAMARGAAEWSGLPAPTWFTTSDPEGESLSSGGGTAHLLAEAWKSLAQTASHFRNGCVAGRKMIIHGGGQGRRLPAYAAVGKPFLPLPILRGEIWAAAGPNPAGFSAASL